MPRVPCTRLSSAPRHAPSICQLRPSPASKKQSPSLLAATLCSSLRFCGFCVAPCVLVCLLLLAPLLLSCNECSPRRAHKWSARRCACSVSVYAPSPQAAANVREWQVTVAARPHTNEWPTNNTRSPAKPPSPTCAASTRSRASAPREKQEIVGAPLPPPPPAHSTLAHISAAAHRQAEPATGGAAVVVYTRQGLGGGTNETCVGAASTRLQWPSDAPGADQSRGSLARDEVALCAQDLGQEHRLSAARDGVRIDVRHHHTGPRRLAIAARPLLVLAVGPPPPRPCRPPPPRACRWARRRRRRSPPPATAARSARGLPPGLRSGAGKAIVSGVVPAAAREPNLPVLGRQAKGRKSRSAPASRARMPAPSLSNASSIWCSPTTLNVTRK